MEDILRSYTTLESKVPTQEHGPFFHNHTIEWHGESLETVASPMNGQKIEIALLLLEATKLSAPPTKTKQKKNPRVSTPWSPWARSLVEGWGESWGHRTPSQDFLVCKLSAVLLLAPLCFRLENLIYPWVKGNLLWVITFRLHYNQASEIHRTRLRLSLKGFTFYETTCWYLTESQPEVPKAKKIC